MVEFFNETQLEEGILQSLQTVEQQVYTFLHAPKSVKVNLKFVSPEEIRTINKQTRQIDKVTDVLSFPYTNIKVGEKLRLKDYVCDIDPTDHKLLLGDVVMCVDRAKQQAEEYGHSLKREICFLFCHAMLHLMGYDHIDPEDEKLMTKKQEEILNSLNITRTNFKAGFVTIVGETNVGKSTLINQLIGEKVAIVSPKSQTTRENITGIYNDKTCQIVFLDTPGYHKRATKIDDAMDKQIENAQEDTEIVLMLISAKKPLVNQYLELIKKVTASAKKVLLINKIDEVKYEKLYPQLAELSGVAKVDEILPISAKTGKNCDVLLEMIKKFLPCFDHEMRYYPIDEYTDKNLRHMCAEIVREKALLLLDDEIPHGIQVVVTDYRENETPIQIYADVYCERESHKAIILGKNGEMIKQISTKARQAIEQLVGVKVNLQLYVKVKVNWRNDERALKDFGLIIEE